MLNIGFFGRMAARYWGIAAEMWRYVGRSNVLVKVLVLPAFLCYLPCLIFVGAVFAALIPLDLFASLIEAIRASMLRFSGQMSRGSGDNFFAFLILPGLLLVLAPFILIIVFIPTVAGLVDE